MNVLVQGATHQPDKINGDHPPEHEPKYRSNRPSNFRTEQRGQTEQEQNSRNAQEDFSSWHISE